MAKKWFSMDRILFWCSTIQIRQNNFRQLYKYTMHNLRRFERKAVITYLGVTKTWFWLYDTTITKTLWRVLHILIIQKWILQN